MRQNYRIALLDRVFELGLAGIAADADQPNRCMRGITLGLNSKSQRLTNKTYGSMGASDYSQIRSLTSYSLALSELDAFAPNCSFTIGETTEGRRGVSGTHLIGDRVSSCSLTVRTHNLRSPSDSCATTAPIIVGRLGSGGYTRHAPSA
jgi:hypothetical protein